MEQTFPVQNWLGSLVLEHSCKMDFVPVLEKILKNEDLVSNLPKICVGNTDDSIHKKIKPVFMFVHVLRNLLSSIENFASESDECVKWNSSTLLVIIKLIETTFEQCEFLNIRKYFALLSVLKVLDMMHLLRTNGDSASLMQRLNVYFPRLSCSEKETLMKQFSITNPKILDKVEESNSQCRRLLLKLAVDAVYRSSYMSELFMVDMKKLVLESVLYLNEAISNILNHAGKTVIESVISGDIKTSVCDDLGYQLLVDYLQPEVSPETLRNFLDEIDSGLAPFRGGFSSCLLPFDTMSECTDDSMDSESDESVPGGGFSSCLLPFDRMSKCSDASLDSESEAKTVHVDEE